MNEPMIVWCVIAGVLLCAFVLRAVEHFVVAYVQGGHGVKHSSAAGVLSGIHSPRNLDALCEKGEQGLKHLCEKGMQGTKKLGSFIEIGEDREMFYVPGDTKYDYAEEL